MAKLLKPFCISGLVGCARLICSFASSSVYLNENEHISSAMEVARTQDHTNDKNKKLKKPSPDVPGKEVPRELCEYEKKAADEGFILPPQNVKHMGNIDDIAQVTLHYSSPV